MRLSVIYFEIAARRQTEVDCGAGGEESRQVAETFARLGAVSKTDEDAQIAALAERIRGRKPPHA